MDDQTARFGCERETLSKMNLLHRLIGKKEPLVEYEEVLKKKLINDMLSN